MLRGGRLGPLQPGYSGSSPRSGGSFIKNNANNEVAPGQRWPGCAAKRARAAGQREGLELRCLSDPTSAWGKLPRAPHALRVPSVRLRQLLSQFPPLTLLLVFFKLR